MKTMAGAGGLVTLAALIVGCAPDVIGAGAGGGGRAGNGSSGNTMGTGSGVCDGSGGTCACAADEVCDSGGRCLTVLAKGMPGPGSIAVDDTYVYWGDVTGSTGNPPTQSVLRCEKAGCGQQPTVLATGQPSGWGVAAIHAHDVFWVTGDGFSAYGAVMRCARDGCGQAPTQVTLGAISPQIAVDATTLYWGTSGMSDQENSGSLWSCPLAGCTPAKIADVASLVGVWAVSATTLLGYYGGPAAPGAGALWTCSPAACAPQILVSPAGGAALDATNAYFGNPAGSVQLCALGGCGDAPTTLFAGAQGLDSSVVTDGVSVYFGTAMMTAMGVSGALLRCPVSGCPDGPTTIACNAPGGIAVDETYVYWTDPNAGLLLRAPK